MTFYGTFKIVEIVPNFPTNLIAGNIATAEGNSIIYAGADVVKVGIGPGINPKNCAVSSPQVTAIYDAAAVAQNMENDYWLMVVSGIQGDIVKAPCSWWKRSYAWLNACRYR